jgi:hypothetical protein
VAAMREVTVQYFADCPNWRSTAHLLEQLADEFDLTILVQRVETVEEAERIGFRGSPTVLIDGRDPFATGDEPTGLACRVYVTAAGLEGAPTEAQLRRVLGA